MAHVPEETPLEQKILLFAFTDHSLWNNSGKSCHMQAFQGLLIWAEELYWGKV